MEEIIIEYAPILIMVLFICLKSKFFITPAQLEVERKNLMKEVREQYLSIVAFREFEKRIDDKFDNSNRRFDRLDENVERVHTGIDHLKDLFLQRGSKDV